MRCICRGDREGLSPKWSEGLAQAEAATADNNRLILNVCFNHGGRWDIASNGGLAAKGCPSPKQACTPPWDMVPCAGS